MEITETEALLGLAVEIVERQTGARDAALVHDVFRQLCAEMGQQRPDEQRGDGEAVH